MLAVELKFAHQTPRGTEAQVSAITSLIGAFIRNGNLVEWPMLASEADGLTVYGTAPARDAFRKATRNVYVQRSISGLAQAKLKGPRVRFLGKIPETAEDCRCARPKGYILFTTFLHLEPPLRCMHCNGTVPLYRLPHSKTGEHSGLLSWQSNYQACDRLQIGCTVGERFGTWQMSDPTSSLSRSGVAVCKEIEGLTGRPVYYYLYRDSTRSSSAESRRNCPRCGGAWLLKTPLHHIFDFKCDECHLLSNIAWNVR
jgi:predicted  nucleic acid-binding Zn ribbon protein